MWELKILSSSKLRKKALHTISLQYDTCGFTNNVFTLQLIFLNDILRFLIVLGSPELGMLSLHPFTWSTSLQAGHFSPKLSFTKINLQGGHCPKLSLWRWIKVPFQTQNQINELYGQHQVHSSPRALLFILDQWKSRPPGSFVLLPSHFHLQMISHPLHDLKLSASIQWTSFMDKRNKTVI